MDHNKNQFLFDPVSGDLKYFQDPDKWNICGPQAAEYIRNHVIHSMENDVLPILDLFDTGAKHQGKGFFSMLRVIFPYLTWAGKLFGFKGSEPQKATEFLKKYSKDQSYQKYGERLYEVYRHGLMHNHFPNSKWKDGKFYSWEITLDRCKHLQEKSCQAQYIDTKKRLTIMVIPISPHQLYEDIHNALNNYAIELEEDKWLKEFHEGFKSKN